MTQNLLIQYSVWHFKDMPKELFKAWKNYLSFYLSFFSTPLLLKTFFSPWHGLRWSYGRGFSASRYLEVFISNGFSRVVGAFLRIFIIAIGFFFEIIIFLLGLLMILTWFLLPILLVIIFLFGIKILF